MQNVIKIIMTIVVFAVFLINLEFSFSNAIIPTAEIQPAEAFKCKWIIAADECSGRCLRDGNGYDCTCGDRVMIIC